LLPDGSFLAPCKCTGTSRYVHARCLKRWIKSVASSRGPSFATRCDICRSSYRRLPANVGPRDNIAHRIRRVCSESYGRALASRAGPLIRSSLRTASIYCSLNGLYCSALQSVALPAMFMQARYDPITALRPLAPRYLAAMILEPFLSSRDFYFHLETALFYTFGWILDASTRTLERMALPMIAGLPPALQLAAAAMFAIPKSFGLVFQALDLTLISLYGGGMGGFLEGGLELVSAPFKILSLAAKCGAGFLGFLAAALAQGGQGAMAAARLIASGTPQP
jgi:RING-variant domain